MSLLASLDLGTNTFRLLIAEVADSNTLIPIVTKRANTRLGEGVDRNGIISPHALERGMEAIDHFSKIIDHHKVEKVFAVSTSVSRDARNEEEFASRVFEKTGIQVRILTGFEEALLTLKGVFSVVNNITQNSLLFDIGGGSTEFILTEDTVPVQITSIGLGVVYLSESLITTDPPIQAELSCLRNNINKSLQSLEINNIISSCQYSLIGTAGTVTTLAAIDQKMEQYDSLKINNHIITQKTIENIYHQLCHLSLTERRAIRGLEEGREAVILPGTAIVLEIMDYFKLDHFRASDAGLLEGILLDAQVTD